MAPVHMAHWIWPATSGNGRQTGSIPPTYSYSPAKNPTGPAQHGEDLTERVVRGGSWLAKPEWIYSANRVNFEEGNRDNVEGFRCAREAQ